MNSWARLLIAALFVGGWPWLAVVKAADSDFPPEYPPVAEANPAVREEREVSVPTGFLAGRIPSLLMINEEAGPLESIKLAVGFKMVLGMSAKVYIYRAGGTRPPKPSMESLGTLMLKPMPGARFYSPPIYPNLFASPDGALQPGKPCIVEIDYEIFETDIPGQHLWSPQSGKYKVLWRTTLRQTVEEKNRLPAEFQKLIDRAPKPQPVAPPPK